MPLKIKIADTPELLDEVFKIRYKVFTEEEGVFPENEEKRYVDRFDAYPTTYNLIVQANDVTAGSFRLTLDSPVGVPADEFFDFRKLLPEDSRIMGAGMLCITTEYRDPQFFTGLLMMASYFGVSHNVSHVIAPINPVIAKHLTRRVGFNIVGEEFLDAHFKTPMLPVMLDTRELKDYFMNFVHENEMFDFIRDYERWFFNEGDAIIKAGEKGKDAFVLIHGRAVTLLHGKEFGEIREGDVFGELSLLTDEPRSADVIAAENTQVMRLPKKKFLKRFLSNPEQTLGLLRIMGKRHLNLISQLQEMK